jgi:hypothetical protein
MPARFTGSAGSPAMILQQESLCIKSFVLKELLLRHLKNKINVSVVKPTVGDLRTGSKQQSRQKQLPPRKHLQHPANISYAAHANAIFTLLLPGFAMLSVDRESYA